MRTWGGSHKVEWSSLRSTRGYATHLARRMLLKEEVPSRTGQHCACPHQWPAPTALLFFRA